MNGMVLEITNTDAVILSDDGTFTKIKNKGYTIGQVLLIQETKKKLNKYLVGLVGAAAAVAIVTIVSIVYYTPTSYVSLDVNPSIAYSVNTFDKVLSVQPVNEDAKVILEELSLINMPIEEAIERTIDDLVQAGFISDDDNGGIIIATSNANEKTAKVLAAKLEEKMQTYINQLGKACMVEAAAIGQDRVEAAKAMGVTPGKLNLVDKLKDSAENPDEINVGEWCNQSVKDIKKAINENKGNTKSNGNNATTTTAINVTGESTTQAHESSSKDIQESNTSTKTENSNKTNGNQTQNTKSNTNNGNQNEVKKGNESIPSQSKTITNNGKATTQENKTTTKTTGSSSVARKTKTTKPNVTNNGKG